MPLIQISLTDTITLEDSLTVNKSVRLSVTDGLTITHSFSTNLKLERIISALSLVGDLSINLIDSKNIVDFLAIDDLVTAARPIGKTVTEVLGITQALVVNLHGRVADSVLTLQHDVDVSKPKSAEAVTLLSGTGDITGVDLSDPEAVAAALAGGLQQAVSVRKILNISLISYISFAQSAAKGHFLSVETVIPLTQVAASVEWELISNGVVLTHSASIDVCKPGFSTLELTQIAEANGVRDRSLSGVLAIVSTVSAFIAELNEYGLIADGNSALDVVTPTLLASTGFVLYYPATSPTETLNLPNPEWDNYIQLEQRRINRRTRGGTLRVSRDPTWPTAQRLKVDFHGLTSTQRDNLLDFLCKTVGKEVKIRDHESREWVGLILTPTAALRSYSRVGYDATLEFEGNVVV